VTQERLCDLALHSIECKIAKPVDFKDIISNFATMTARKVFFKVLFKL